MSMIRRRDLLKAAAAATLAGGFAPSIGRTESAKTLRFVGVADLSVLDPVVTGARPTRNAAYLIFDTLYGLDTEWQAQPQMVAGHSVEDDGLVWNLTLRDGLRFHDGEPVLATDVVTSIRRLPQRPYRCDPGLLHDFLRRPPRLAADEWRKTRSQDCKGTLSRH